MTRDEYEPRLDAGELLACGSKRSLWAVHEKEKEVEELPGPLPLADKTLVREALEVGGFVFQHSRSAYSWADMLDDALFNRRMASVEK